MPPQFRSLEEVTNKTITAEEGQLMVRLHAQKQQPNTELTLGSVMELLHLSPEEAESLLNQVRQGLPPQQFTPVHPNRLTTGGKSSRIRKVWLIPAVIFFGMFWASMAMRVVSNARHTAFRTISGNSQAPTIASGIKGAPGIDLRMDLGYINEGIYGGPTTGKPIGELSHAEAKSLRAKIAESVVEALQARRANFYALEVQSGNSRSIGLSIRPFGSSGAWTHLNVPVDPEMMPLGWDANAGASLAKQIESGLESHWDEIVK